MKLLVLGLMACLVGMAGPDQPGTFQKLAADAAAAREANDLPRAASLYGEALREQPTWEEGWWSLGSLLYDANQYDKAAGALSKLVALNPKAAPGWGLLGLCEYETGPAEKSLADIQRALALGLPGQAQMEGVLRYHEAALLVHERDFDNALREYAWFVQKGVQHDTLLVSLGLAALRNPILPEALAPADRDVTLAAGRAAFLSMSGQSAEAQQAVAELAAKYPSVPGVHYLYGTMLMASDPEKGTDEMRKELAVAPGNGAANATVAWTLLDDGEFADAQPFAATAFHAEPKLSLAQYVYGRSLAHEGNVDEAIAHLETAVKMAPDTLVYHVALAAAYSQGAHPEQARQERLLAMKMAKEGHATSAP